MEHQLSNTWVLWYHRINDSDWDENSYTRLFEIKTIEDYWRMMNTLRTFTSGMFFMMKDDIFPRWEDMNNIDGGYWTFRVIKNDCDKIWRDLLAHLVGNHLTKDVENMSMINGISLSPKINNCIIKVWNNDYKLDDVNVLCETINGISLSEAFYRKHQDQSDFNLDSS